MSDLLLAALTPFAPSADENEQLVTLAKFYIRRAKFKFLLRLPSTDCLIEAEEIAQSALTIDLHHLAAKLRKEKKITDYPVAAMLATDFKAVSPHIDTLNDIKAISIIVAAWYLETGRSFQDLKKFCYAVRIMTTTKGNWLLKLMPNLIPAADQLLSALDTQQVNVPFGEIRRFKELLHPLKSLVLNRSANRKSEQELSDKGERESQPRIEEKSGKVWFGDQQVTFLSDPPEQINPLIAQEEQTHDQSKPSFTIEVNDQNSSKNKRSQIEREIRGQDIANVITRKSIRSVFDWGHLSENEISRLFQHQFKVAQDGSVASLFVCLSLLTGRRVDDLLRLKLKTRGQISKGDQWVAIKGQMCLVSVLDLPENNVQNSANVYFSTEKDIYLPIPLSFSDLFDKALKDKQVKDIDFSSHLSHLNRRFKNRLSQNRLAEVSQRFYVHQGIQKPILAAITGQTAKHNPSLYYCGMERQAISQAYLSFIEHLKNITGNSSLALPEAKSSQRVGSNSATLSSVVQGRFHKIRKFLEQTRSWHEHHNVMTFYTLEVLSLATGHRSVGSPFEKITDFDLSHGQVWISDKENRQEQSSRILPLAQTAFKQLKQYIEHLRSSQYHHSILKPKLAEEIGKSLTGESDFLFFITGEKLLPIAPNIITEMENLLHLPNLRGNWARHFLYSHLIAQSGCPNIVANFFGHAGFGEEAGDPFSRFCVKNSGPLLAQIQTLLTDLGIETLSGWQEGRT